MNAHVKETSLLHLKQPSINARYKIAMLTSIIKVYLWRSKALS